MNAQHALRDYGWLDRMVNRLSRLVTWRRIDNEGSIDTVDSVVARIEVKLEFGDLIAAVETLETLAGMSESAAAAAAPWMAIAKARLAVERAITIVIEPVAAVLSNARGRTLTLEVHAIDEPITIVIDAVITQLILTRDDQRTGRIITVL